MVTTGEKSSRRWVFVLLTASVALTVGSGCKRRKGRRRGPVKQEAVPVRVETVAKRKWAETAGALGTLEPWRQVVLKAETAGRVLKLKAEVGETKDKGDVVAVIDVSTAWTVHQANRVAIRQAKTQVAQTRRDYERARRLMKSGDLSKAMFEKAEHAYNLAKLQLNAARAQLRRTGRSLADSRVKVPFGGVVSQRHVELGAYVMPATPIITLMETRRLKLVVGLPVSYAVRLKPGMSATVTLEGLGGVRDRADAPKVAASVHLVRPAADSQTRLLDVEFEIKNPGRKIRPGVVARARVPLGGTDSRVFIRSDAVVEMMKIQYAYVVENGKAVRRRVKLGAEEGSLVEIKEGLKPGDILVTVGQNRLVPGVPVRILKNASAPERADERADVRQAARSGKPSAPGRVDAPRTRKKTRKPSAM
jgi:RND family efflux transporter MFP subunit